MPSDPGQDWELRWTKTSPYLCSLSTSLLPTPGQGTKILKRVDSVRSLSFSHWALGTFPEGSMAGARDFRRRVG